MSSDQRVKIDPSLKPFEVKTKEEKNAERLQILASSKPYMHKRPEGIAFAESFMFNEELEKFKQGKEVYFDFARMRQIFPNAEIV